MSAAPTTEDDDTATTSPHYLPALLGVLAQMEGNYCASNNPLFAWNAIAFCTEHGLPIPEFASEYIKQVAVALSPFIKEAMLRGEKDKIDPEEIPKRVLDALQITTGAGRPNAFEGIRRHFSNENALLMEPVRKIITRQPHHCNPEEKAAADKIRRRKLASARVLRSGTKAPP
jgi:hypothetical protein